MIDDQPDNLTFVFIGTQDYHFMINKNIELLGRVYPGFPVVVYDWGDGCGNPSGTKFQNDVEVIDWRERIMDTWDLMKIYSATRRVEIGKAFNSRLGRGVGTRVNKFFLKRFPNSSQAKSAIERGLRYENLLLHKSYNLQHCSKHLAEKRFFLIDADAFLVERIDEIFEGEPDIILPMGAPEMHCWNYNNCHGLSTGVMGFSNRTNVRDAFLSEWFDAIRGNDEWLRELAAMNRMIKFKSANFFNDWKLTTLTFGSQDARILTVENDVYNCVYNYQDKPKDISRAKILHLAGIAQQPNLFPEYISYVEAELSVRGY